MEVKESKATVSNVLNFLYWYTGTLWSNSFVQKEKKKILPKKK